MAMNDPLDRRQSDSGSRKFVLGVKTLKGAEQLAGVIHVEPGAVVFYEIRRDPTILAHRAEFDAARGPVSGELPRIVQQVQCKCASRRFARNGRIEANRKQVRSIARMQFQNEPFRREAGNFLCADTYVHL